MYSFQATIFLMLNYAFPTLTEFPLADLDNETKAKQKPHGNKIITENNIRRKQPFRGGKECSSYLKLSNQ